MTYYLKVFVQFLQRNLLWTSDTTFCPFFFYFFEQLGFIPLTGKRIKYPKKSAINDHILLKCHYANYANFTHS